MILYWISLLQPDHEHIHLFHGNFFLWEWIKNRSDETPVLGVLLQNYSSIIGIIQSEGKRVGDGDSEKKLYRIFCGNLRLTNVPFQHFQSIHTITACLNRFYGISRRRQIVEGTKRMESKSWSVRKIQPRWGIFFLTNLFRYFLFIFFFYFCLW